MVFKIKSQYIDPVGKLRIIYGVFNSHAINLLTFPSAPLDKVSIELDHKVTPFLEINAAFIENFKEELESDPALLSALERLIDKMDSLDSSVDYLAALMSGVSPEEVELSQTAFGRLAGPGGGELE